MREGARLESADQNKGQRKNTREEVANMNAECEHLMRQCLSYLCQKFFMNKTKISIFYFKFTAPCFLRRQSGHELTE